MGDYSDSSNNLQFLFKKSLGIISTFKDTAFYNEVSRRFRTPVQVEDVNIETAPTLPEWNDSSDNSLFNLGSDDFASVDFTELHTYDSTYTKNGTKSPGVWLDASGTVALFVRLKLDKMEGDATTNLDASAIVYTKYPIDSSNISLMDSAYQFNYNSQINVNSSIPVFKPYNYTLEYSSDDSTFYQVTNDMGNWSFDTNSGTIIFEDDPSLNNNIIDLSNGDLYFTFVKYVGLQGIQNLIYHDASGHSGIGTKDPQSELDISGSMRISKDLTLTEDLYVTLTDVLHVDSTSERVGINTDSPITDLDVSGDTQISGTLDISSGIGPGMCPIGTIIIWVSTTPPSSDYGTWLLCDGSVINTSTYSELYTILGADSLPDFKDKYTRGAASGATNISTGGSNTTSSISLAATNLPSHSHDVSGHGHTISVAQHTHKTDIDHQHNAIANEHGHSINAHYHDISDSNTSHTHNTTADHTHSTTEVVHKHKIAHGHNEIESGHQHNYELFVDFGVNDAKRGAKAPNLIDTLEKRRQWNELDTSVPNTNSTDIISINGAIGNTDNSTVDIVTNMIGETAVNLQSTTTYGSTIKTNSLTCGNSDNSVYTTNPSLNDATSITTNSSDLGATLNMSTSLSHDVAGNYGASFTFDNVNPSCIEIFYYIRAK